MEPDTIELIDYIRLVWKKRWLIAGITIFCMVVAGIISLILPKMYKASVIFLVEESIIPPENIGPQPNPRIFETYTRTYEKMIKNKNLLLQTISRFHLDETPYELDLEELEKMISVNALRNSKLLEMTVEFPDSKLASDIANFMASKAMELNRSITALDSMNKKEFIKKQLDSAKTEMDAAEKKLLEFKRKAQLPVLRKKIEVLLSRKGEIEKALLQVAVSIAEKEAYLKKIRDELESREPTRTLSRKLAEDPIYQQFMAQLSKSDVEKLFSLNMEVETINTTYTHLEKQLVNTTSLLNSLYARKQLLSQELKDNTTALDKLLGELADKEIELKRLQRIYNIAVDTYKKFKSRFNEIIVEVASKTPDIKIIDAAIPPTRPFKPRILFNIGVAGSIGFVFSLFLAFFIEYLSNVKEK